MRIPVLLTTLLALAPGCVETTLPQTKDKAASLRRGQAIYARECAACHGANGQGAGPASLGLGVAAPDLAGLKGRNDGHFPREFVRRFILGMAETHDAHAAMPDFAKVGLRHAHRLQGVDGDLLEADLNDLLDYLGTIQQ